MSCLTQNIFYRIFFFILFFVFICFLFASLAHLHAEFLRRVTSVQLFLSVGVSSGHFCAVLHKKSIKRVDKKTNFARQARRLHTSKHSGVVRQLTEYYSNVEALGTH